MGLPDPGSGHGLAPHGIELRGVSVRLQEREVLSSVSLTLTERRIGVIGANGSGKSTLARLLNGLVLPSAGEVEVLGLSTARQAAKVRRRVGFIFTDPASQIVMPTVAEDVAFSLRKSGLSKSEKSERVRDSLSYFDLAEHADHPAHLLSGGQKQMLALCSVLINKPEVIVADEPTTLLDLRNARKIGSLLDSLRQQVVLVTHQLELVEGYDRVLLIDEGRVAADGPPDDVLPAYRRLMR